MKRKKRSISESEAGGHTGMAYGIYDRPGPEEGMGDHDSFSSSKPIVPVEQVSTQLSADRPPIDDPEFVPTGKRSFEIAMLTLASYVPEDKISKLYKLMRDKVENLVDSELMISKYSGEKVMESVEDKIKKMLSEQFSDKELESMKGEFDEEFGDDDEDTEEELPFPGDASLEQIASHTGFSGPSGVKNFLYRLLSRMSRFENVPPDELDALIDFAAGEYVDVLHQAKLIDDEDSAFLMKNKEHVFDLPSFKFFVSNAIVSPALKELERTGKKRVDSLLDKIKLSSKTRNALMNQLMGQVPKNEKLISSRIDADRDAGKMTEKEAGDAKDKIRLGFSAMKKVVMSGDNFVEVALQRYSKMSRSKLLNIVKKASEDTFVAEKL
jgi:hypothetical protein